MASSDLVLAGTRRDADTTPAADGGTHSLYTNEDGRLKVAAKPGAFPVTTQNITSNGQTVPVSTATASNITIHIKGGGTAGAGGNFTFEGSVDSTNGTDGTWFGIQAVRTNANTIETATGVIALAINTGNAYAWEASVNAYQWVRVRATAFTSGIYVVTVIRGSYATEPIPAAQITGTQPVSGSVTVSGTATTTPATGTAASVVTAATTNATVLKGSAGNLFELTVSNVTATACFLKLYSKATAPTVGTDIPLVTIPIAANTTVPINFGAQGKRFGAGIALAVTAAAAATDTGATVAGIQLSGTYV